jgi:predicted Zn-dependent peptidase
MKKILFFLIVLIPAITAGSLRAETITDAGSYLEKNIVDATLSNGIHVQLLDRGYAPTLAMIISFNVGSSDEDSTQTGIAHMLEHMLFKGTETVGTLDYAKEKPLLEKIEALGEEIDRLAAADRKNPQLPELIDQLAALQAEHDKYFELNPYGKIYAMMGGVSFNAFTSHDMTAYHIELPVSGLEQWAKIESDRIQHPVFRQFYSERGAVAQERLMRYDSEGEPMLMEAFGGAAFLAHPYRIPVIGWESNVRSMSFTRMREFYADRYVPSAMNISIVGKQDPKKTIALLEKYFGVIPARTPKTFPIVSEPQQKGERRINVEFDAKPYLMIGWHKPTLPSQDDYCMDLVSALLSDGKMSRLYRSLVLEKKIASSVDAGNGFPGAKYDNLFVIDAEPKRGVSCADLEKAIYDEIEKLSKDVTKAELDQARLRISSERIFKLDSNLGIAREINYYATVTGDWRYAATYRAKLAAVTPEDVKRVILQYFTEENRTVGVLVSAPAKQGE